MWSKSPLLLLRVWVKKDGRGFGFFLALASYALTGVLLAWEPLLGILPGPWGERARKAVDAALTVFWLIMDSEPQNLVQVDAGKDSNAIKVDLRTLGVSSERGKTQ